MASNAELTAYINSLSPVCYWRMDEASGTTFAQTGSSTAGAMTAAGTVTAANAELIPGDSARFATFSSGGYTSASRGNVTVPFTDVSISYLIRFYPPNASANLIFALTLMGLGDASATTNAQTYQYFTPTDGKFNEIMEYGTGVNELVTSQQPLDLRFFVANTDNTFLVTTVRNSATRQLSTYLNGKLFDQQTYANNPTGGNGAGVVFSLSNNTAVGIQAGVNPSSIGHVCMFNRLLTEQEVVDMSQAAGHYDAAASQVRFISSSNSVGPSDAELTPDVLKVLFTAVDPLIDISVAFPDDAYTTEE